MTEFTINSRKKDLSLFMQELNNKIDQKFYPDTLKYFTKVKLAQGIEGIVYKSQFKNKNLFKKKLAIKVVDIEKVIDVKGVNASLLAASPTDVYKTFFDTETYDSDTIVEEPLFTEVYAFTLLNQMIYQNICPHFIQNYTWEFSTQKSFNIINEFVNGGDLESFLDGDIDNDIMYNVLFQIMYSIISYRRYFNMIHGDLHIGNILLQNVKKGGYWKYTVNGKNYYLPNLGFIIILNDFGFASIPDKLQIDWFYKDKLRYLTKNGQEFYDIQHILSYFRLTDMPKKFKQTIKELKSTDDFKLIYSSDFPRRKKNYPKNINVNYNGSGKMLLDYFKEIFENMYDKIPEESDLIDSYSLDKKYITKFPAEYSYFENFVLPQSKQESSE